jgi:hypothetical protein
MDRIGLCRVCTDSTEPEADQLAFVDFVSNPADAGRLKRSRGSPRRPGIRQV